jgi:hypothetical protein
MTAATPPPIEIKTSASPGAALAGFLQHPPLPQAGAAALEVMSGPGADARFLGAVMTLSEMERTRGALSTGLASTAAPARDPQTTIHAEPGLPESQPS